MQNGKVIKKTWILLDTCSTDSLTYNLDYVKYVNNFAKHKELTVLTNVRSLPFGWKGRLTFLPLNFQVNKNYLAKILSLKDLKNIPGICVTMDTSIDNYVNVVIKYGTVFRFK